MKHQQSGFTLIELVVVMVVIGTLSATAIPKFNDLTDSADLAIAEGMQSAFISEATILFGVNSGSSSTLSTIAGNVTTTGADGTFGGSCGGMTAAVGTQTTGSIAISSDLCSG